MPAIPRTIPYLRAATLLAALYGIVWLGLEGALWRDLVWAVLLAALGLAWGVTRIGGGRTVSAGAFVALMAGLGLLLGVGTGLMLLFLMSLKTGLHAHGPEYTAAAVWVWRQLPLWAAVGTSAGVGVGLLLAAGLKEIKAEG